VDERVRECASVVATRQVHANDRYLMRRYEGIESRLLGRVRYVSCVMRRNESGDLVRRTDVNRDARGWEERDLTMDFQKSAFLLEKRPRMQFLCAFREYYFLICPACYLAQNGPHAKATGRGEHEELFRKLQRQHNYSSLSRVKPYGTREFRPRARTVKSVNALKIKTGSAPGWSHEGEATRIVSLRNSSDRYVA